MISFHINIEQAITNHFSLKQELEEVRIKEASIVELKCHNITDQDRLIAGNKELELM